MIRDDEQLALQDGEPEIEERPYPPFLPPQATVMLMGTFPPKGDKHSMAFHYPNFQNDMWRVYGLVFFDDADHFRKGEEKAFDAEKIKAFLLEKGIASCPTVKRAIRGHGNASDAFLEVVEAVDLEAVLKEMPRCEHIAVTGGKAGEVLLSVVGCSPKEIKAFKTGDTMAIDYKGRHLTITRLPSTSRAYPMKLSKKAEAYGAFFRKYHIL